MTEIYVAIHIIIILIATAPRDRVEYDSAIEGHGYGCVWNRQGDKFMVDTEDGRIELYKYELKLLEEKC